MNLAWFLFSLKGRIGRKAWWVFFAIKISIILLWAYGTPDDPENLPDAVIAVFVLGCFALAWMEIAVGVKRLHDIDWSGWWMLMQLVPVIGVLVILIMNGFIEGSRFPNRFDQSISVKESA